MKEETLAKVNALLAELAKEAGPDGAVGRSPASIASSVGLSSGLETARAMRALLARKRVEGGENGYRVVSTEPIVPGEPLAIVPQRRKRARGARGSDGGAKGETVPSAPTYGDIGRAVVERLVDLTREAGELRAGRGSEDRARLETAERRASAAEQRAKELQVKLEMAESNLREVLRAASLAKGSGSSAPIDDPEAAAVLRFLQSGDEEPATE
ncbi:MAG: hypothetical protein ABR548_08595 [Actinomycetota bacterium]|nr:hypothetical protein [Actinomycetota bacterium]